MLKSLIKSIENKPLNPIPLESLGPLLQLNWRRTSFVKYRRVCICKVGVVSILLSVAALTGCESIRYYNHLISGQINIVNKNKPIHQLLDEPHVSEKLKAQLKLVLDIREFAKNELYLPVKNQYLSFADLQRPFAVWNVYATRSSLSRP